METNNARRHTGRRATSKAGQIFERLMPDANGGLHGPAVQEGTGSGVLLTVGMAVEVGGAVAHTQAVTST